MSTEATSVIVAIDPSLSNTAIVMGDTNDPYITCQSSKPCGTSVHDRICRYANQVYSVIDEIDTAKKRVRAIYIEGYSMGSRAGQITGLCEYGGILRHALLGVCERIYEVAPSTLKKFATGKGVGSKDMIAAHLTKRYGVLLNSNDEYDAYGLYRLGRVAEGLEPAANQSQQEAVNTVLGLNAKPKRKKKSA